MLSLEFYLGTTLWFRFCLAPVAVYLGLTNSPVAAENVDWMGSLVLGFSHTTAFAFGNFLYQDYYRRGFDKKPEYAFIKYYSIYGSIFVIGRMTTQVLCSMRSKLPLLLLYFTFDGVREHSGGLVILSLLFVVFVFAVHHVRALFSISIHHLHAACNYSLRVRAVLFSFSSGALQLIHICHDVYMRVQDHTNTRGVGWSGVGWSVGEGKG